jgi:nitroreductase/NAD-dependent dihydropyrimidine dehydrogenase PreA subunit
MGREPITEIDVEKCTGCGSCVEICPSDTLSLVDGKARVTGDDSMQCAQCVAICPEGAVSLPGVSDPIFSTIASGSPAQTLIDVMRNRRSVRVYSEIHVDLSQLEDLVKAGIVAPSGTNSQKWTFTILPTRSAMEALAEHTAHFYEKTNRMAKNPVLRFFSSLSKKDPLGTYYRRYYESVKEALDSWRKERRDQLFHGATAGIVIGMQPGASCGPEDALLAAQNIQLVAHAMGLGTCLIGFAVEAMKRDPSVQESIGIPKDETVYAVVAIGRPAVLYVRPSGRKQPVIRYFQG